MQLNNEGIFMGPICDSCIEGFDKMNTKMEDISTNLGTMENYLVTTSNTYQSGDAAAHNQILQFSGSKVTTTTAGAATSGSTNSNVSTGHANQDSIYNYLAKQGFNDAAICGILANIEKESGFNPNSLGDHGTSYGICQWHNNRWTQLKNYCSQNGLDSTSIDGQVSYLVWELKNKYPSVYQKLQNVPNNAQGAYAAAYEWTVHFEVPANKYSAGQTRGSVTSQKYWPTYSKSS